MRKSILVLMILIILRSLNIAIIELVQSIDLEDLGILIPKRMVVFNDIIYILDKANYKIYKVNQVAGRS